MAARKVSKPKPAAKPANATSITPRTVPAMSTLQWTCCRVEALAEVVDDQVSTLAQGIEIDAGALLCIVSLLREQAGELMRGLEEYSSVEVAA